MSVSKFTINIPSNNLEKSHSFFNTLFALNPIQQNQHKIKYNFYNHHLTIHYLSPDYVPKQHCNHVDQHDVPVPHFGIVLTVDQFKELSQRLIGLNVEFIIRPCLRFKGLKGQQYTMFFKDPTGNNLQFKAMANPDYLFTPQ